MKKYQKSIADDSSLPALSSKDELEAAVDRLEGAVERVLEESGTTVAVCQATVDERAGVVTAFVERSTDPSSILPFAKEPPHPTSRILWRRLF